MRCKYSQDPTAVAIVTAPWCCGRRVIPLLSVAFSWNAPVKLRAERWADSKLFSRVLSKGPLKGPLRVLAKTLIGPWKPD